MSVLQLRIKDTEPSLAQVVDEMNQAHLAGIGAASAGATEHGFAAKNASDGKAVQAAYQNHSLAQKYSMRDFTGRREPRLNAVRMPRGVQFQERIDDVGMEPDFRRGAIGGTGTDDLPESLIAGDGEATLADFGSERARDMEAIVKRDQPALARLSPFDDVWVAIEPSHGKPAATVHLEHAVNEGHSFREREHGQGIRSGSGKSRERALLKSVTIA